jgi:NHL repeat-containing protein
MVTTLAGSTRLSLGSTGTPYSRDGVGTNASFNNPSALAIDAAGNIYVADSNSEVIRKTGTNGVVTTLAGAAGFGNGTGGSADGAGATARFSRMSGLAVDGAGNIYVADTGNETIRMITPNGFVTTIGGVTDVAGAADGFGAGVLFSLPSGIAVSASGNIYVADALNNSIRVGVLPPALQITGGSGAVTISWAVSPGGFVLETSPFLGPAAAWITLTNSSSVAGGLNYLTNLAGDAARFYRLHTP